MMDSEKALDVLSNIIFDNALPHTVYMLVGVRCPYCGKSDRIRPLESPGEVSGLSESEFRLYRDAWDALTTDDGTLGVCFFCRQVIGLDVDLSRAGALTELE